MGLRTEEPEINIKTEGPARKVVSNNAIYHRDPYSSLGFLTSRLSSNLLGTGT